MDQYRHRASTGQKQKNKGHTIARGQRRIKGAGRTETSGRWKRQDHSKEKRLQHSRQSRKDKREEILKLKRDKRDETTTPRLVALIPLSAKSDCVDVAKRLVGCCEACDTAEVNGCQTVAICSHLSVVCAGHGNLVASLKACARADVVVMVMHPVLDENDGDKIPISSKSAKLVESIAKAAMPEAS